MACAAAAATLQPSLSLLHRYNQRAYKTHTILLAQSLSFPVHPLTRTHQSARLFSIDVSKEDTPTEAQEEEEGKKEKEKEKEAWEEEMLLSDRLRAEEKFAVLNTGVYQCRSCGYIYDKAIGDPSYPIPPGMELESLPEDWRCPTCGAAKSFFESKSIEIAGFAQNQQFGLGGNTLTSGQKTLLIYGSLLLFFGIFLSGYFLQ